MLTLVRVPYLSEYNLLDVREEPILSSLAGYLASINVPFQVFDFHLDRSVNIQKLKNCGADTYVIGVRGSGLHWKYAERIATHLIHDTDAKIILYGQTGKLQHWHNPHPERIQIVMHDERACAAILGLSTAGPSFKDGLWHYPYAFDSWPVLGDDRKQIFKATIETTRGCHFGCKFCFINHGISYLERYVRRPNDDVLADMRRYLDKGISQFWFYDAEFIGADSSHYSQIEDLLARIIYELPPVEIMIYSRADTLEKFGNYELLSAAGVNSVLLGIESLNDADLKTMRKALTPSISSNAIRNLRRHNMFCTLSFILFNRSTTVQSLRENIEKFTGLFREDNFIYLGQTMYFTYAFESDWQPNNGFRSLSGKTRLNGSTDSTRSPNKGITFDPLLEPYAEICRILNYEQVRKLSELNLVKEKEDPAIRESVHRWATLLTLFTLNLMTVALDEFEEGRLNLGTVDLYEKWVFECYKRFNLMLLPDKWAHTITDHSGYFIGDWNGWESKIPTPQKLIDAA